MALTIKYVSVSVLTVVIHTKVLNDYVFCVGTDAVILFAFYFSPKRYTIGALM